MRGIALLVLVCSSVASAQPDATHAIPPTAPPPGHTVAYVDAPESWNRYDPSGHLHTREILTPDSNLVAAPCPIGSEPIEEAAAAFARVNEWEPDRAVNRFRVVERLCFEADSAHIGFLRARATADDHEALVIWVEARDVERRYFAEANTLDERGWLRAFAFEDGEPVLYGHRAGNPNLPHGGDFRLLLLPDERRIWFEVFEEAF